MAALAALAARRLAGARRLDVLQSHDWWGRVQWPAIRQSATGATGAGTMETPVARDAVAADEPAAPPAEAGTVRPRDEPEATSQGAAAPANDAVNAPAKRYAPAARSDTVGRTR